MYVPVLQHVCTHTHTHTHTGSLSVNQQHTPTQADSRRPPPSPHTPVHFLQPISPHNCQKTPSSLLQGRLPVLTLFFLISGSVFLLMLALVVGGEIVSLLRAGFKCVVVLARASCVSKTGFRYAGKACCFKRRRCTWTLPRTERVYSIKEPLFHPLVCLSLPVKGLCFGWLETVVFLKSQVTFILFLNVLNANPLVFFADKINPRVNLMKYVYVIFYSQIKERMN